MPVKAKGSSNKKEHKWLEVLELNSSSFWSLILAVVSLGISIALHFGVEFTKLRENLFTLVIPVIIALAAALVKVAAVRKKD